jgi:hypothetical protein
MRTADVGKVAGLEEATPFSLPGGADKIVRLQESGSGGGYLLGVLSDGGLAKWDRQT